MIAEAPTLVPGRGARGWRWVVSTTVLVASAGILLTGLFSAYRRSDPERLGWDFRVAYLPAAELVADGGSPYPADPSDPQPGELTAYHYPPQLAFAAVPLTVLSSDAAAVLAVLVSLAALMGALALVGIRDVRCYAVVVLWAPGWNALETANVSALLAFGVALAWRYRESSWRLGGAIGS